MVLAVEEVCRIVDIAGNVVMDGYLVRECRVTVSRLSLPSRSMRPRAEFVAKRSTVMRCCVTRGTPHGARARDTAR